MPLELGFESKVFSVETLELGGGIREQIVGSRIYRIFGNELFSLL